MQKYKIQMLHCESICDQIELHGFVPTRGELLKFT